MTYLLACLIGLLLSFVISAVIVYFLMRNAPEGREIPGVGFVRKPK